jgi:hypothetical protein
MPFQWVVAVVEGWRCVVCGPHAAPSDHGVSYLQSHKFTCAHDVLQCTAITPVRAAGPCCAADSPQSLNPGCNKSLTPIPQL